MEKRMSKINIERLTHKELVQLQQEITMALGERRAQELQTLKRRIADMASSAGFDLGEVVGGGRGGKRGPAPIKFRNPKNSAQTWTGRGRKPLWMVEALKKGQRMESFAI
jgi:DNA-binding protein H-NS